MPDLTIGMPVYNGERHIPEVLNCLLNQTFRTFRLLIADNASTDNTSAICRAFAQKDERIVYIRHSENRGATANYNYVARRADTTYFKWHSSNDLLSANAIESCLGVLRARPEVALAFPSTYLFEHSIEESTEYKADPVADQDDPVERFLYIIDNMPLNNMMNGVLRRDALLQTKMLREFYTADRGLMAELALHGKLIKDERSKFFRRMDESSATQKKSAAEVLKHFDPNWERPPAFAAWKTFGAYLNGLWCSPISARDRLRGTLGTVRRGWWSRNHLSNDIATYLKFGGARRRRYVGGGE